MPLKDSERWVSYSMTDLYPDWQQEAHCLGVGNAYYFGEDDDAMPTRIRQTRNAAKLCDACPVFLECLRHALEYREEYGVWAGTSGRARRKLFSMMDTGETSVDEIIEVVTHERRGTPACALQPRRSSAGDASSGALAL